MVVMVIVMVVVTILTAGAALAAMGPAAAAAGGAAAAAAGATSTVGMLAAAGAAAVTGGIGGAATLAGIAAAAVGGMVGSAVSQLAGMTLGAVDDFSWGQVAVGGITSAFSAGVGGVLNGGQTAAQLAKSGGMLNYGKVAASAALNNFSGYAANKLVGNDVSFSWSGVAAASIASVAASGISNSIGLSGDNFYSNFGSNVVASQANSSIQKLLGRGGKIDYLSVAADAFGNAIGNGLIESSMGGEFFGPRDGLSRRQLAAQGARDFASGDLVADEDVGAFGNALGNFVVDSMAPKASAPAPAQQAQNDDVFDIEGNFKRGIGEKLDKHFEEQYQQQLQDERDTLLAEQFDREMASAKPGSIFDYDGPIITSHELSPRERATVNAVRSPGSMNPYTGEPDILTFSGALMDEAAAQARNNGPQMVATTDRDIALQRGRQAFADSLTGRGESFEMRAGRSLMDAAGLALGPEVLAIGLGTKIVQGAISLTKAGSALSTAAGRLDYSARFSDDLVNFNPGARHFSGALDEDMLLIQYHRSDRSLGQGRSAAWWTTPQAANPLGTEAAVRQSFALPPGWGPRDAVSVARIPKGAQVEYFSGTAARQMEGTTIYRGDGQQLRFKNFDRSWIIETRKIPGER